jgi:hypothetical protein
VPVFLERFVLPLFAAATIIVAITNPMGLDTTERIVGALILIAAAYLVGYEVHKRPPREGAAPPPTTQPSSPPNDRSTKQPEDRDKPTSEQKSRTGPLHVQARGVVTPPPKSGLQIKGRGTTTPPREERYPDSLKEEVAKRIRDINLFSAGRSNEMSKGTGRTNDDIGKESFTLFCEEFSDRLGSVFRRAKVRGIIATSVGDVEGHYVEHCKMLKARKLKQDQITPLYPEDLNPVIDTLRRMSDVL